MTISYGAHYETHLLGIGTAVPQYGATQSQSNNFMHNVLAAKPGTSPVQLALLKRLCANTGIEKRHSVLGDYLRNDPEEFEFFPKNWGLDPSPSTASRMVEYEKHAVNLAAQAAKRAIDEAGISAEKITHLVISTCTGFFAPGPDVLLLRKLGIPTTARRTVLGFMGCYAGVSGIASSHQIVQSDPDAVVLQIALELCSLHYQNSHESDLMVANAIFADGAAAAIYRSSLSSQSSKASVVGAWSDITPDSADHMSWRIGDHGFLMKLDASIPAVIHDAVLPFLNDLAAVGNVSREDITGWVIHPGGRKIIDSIQDALTLSDEDTQSSRAILRDHGNMSSATILFVLKQELDKLNAANCARGSHIAAMAFGPGLTMEGALLKTS